MSKRFQLNQLCDAANTIAELEKLPLYEAGDNTFVMTAEDATVEDFLALADDIRGECGAENVVERTVCDNRFLWAGCGKGYKGIYYIPCRRQIRMVVCTDGALAPERLTQEDVFEENKRLIQLCPDVDNGCFGMGYILCLGKGHFIIYDGGGDNAEMAEKILGTLVENTPEGCTPVVDAWIITHPHWDHVASVIDFGRKYLDRATVRNILANITPYDNLRPWDKMRAYNTEFYAKRYDELRSVYKGSAIWKVHTGQRFDIADVRLEILSCHEDVPIPMSVNDTSLVTIVYVNGKKIFFPADIEGEIPCALLHDAYGSYLKSDYYQAAHHGWGTEALRFYDDVDAPVVLWPLKKDNWERIQKFPATQRMVRDIEEKAREFLITIDDDHILEIGGKIS